MKKIVLVVLALTLLAASAFGFDTWRRSVTLLVTEGGTDNTTVTFTLPSNVGHNSYLHVPTIDSAAVALSCSVDGSTFGTMATNYSATALIDFTYAATTGGKVLKLPDISACRLLKITFGAGQTDNVTLTAFGN
jgi:hypothetical protein